MHIHAYVFHSFLIIRSCGESLRLKADIDNQSEENVRLKLRLTQVSNFSRYVNEIMLICELFLLFFFFSTKITQYVEFFIERGVVTLNKEVNHTILEYCGDLISPHTRTRFDSANGLILPTMPPTMSGICRLLQVYYVLKVISYSNLISVAKALKRCFISRFGSSLKSLARICI